MTLLQAPRTAPPGWDQPARGECHTWLIPIYPRPGWLDLLDATELRRVQTLVAGQARDTFVTSRAGQRLLGSRYLGVPASEVVITRACQHCQARQREAQHGRPVFAGASIDYSVSHAGDWVLVALVATGLVGVDIESVTTRRDIDGLSAVTLSVREQALVSGLSPAARTMSFFSSWTRKEAAMKLSGLGLQAPPNQIDVSGSLVVADDVPRWPAEPMYLRELAGPAGHVAALATTVPLAAVRQAVWTDGRQAR